MEYWIDMHNVAAHAMVAYGDQITATPIYTDARDRALREGKDLDDAIYLAEKAVREAHGSASLVDRANVGRTEMGRWLTMFYNGYWNHNYNKYRSEGRLLFGPEVDYQGAGGAQGRQERMRADMKIALGAAFLIAFIAVPAIWHQIVRPGKGDESWGETVAKGLITQLASVIPGLNNIVYGLVRNPDRDPQVAPMDTLVKPVADLYRDIMVKKHLDTKSVIVHAAQIPSHTVGFPSGAMIDSASYAVDILSGKHEPEDPLAFARGILQLGDKDRPAKGLHQTRRYGQ
jgi:hypothetical protein